MPTGQRDSSDRGGKLNDPEWRANRARKAAQARTSPDKLISALEAQVESLTEEHRLRLARLLAILPPEPAKTVAGIRIGG